MMREKNMSTTLARRRLCLIASAVLLVVCLSPLSAQTKASTTSIDVLHYDFHLELSDETDRIEGRALVQFQWTNAGGEVALDLASAEDAAVSTEAGEGNKRLIKGMMVSSVRWLPGRPPGQWTTARERSGEVKWSHRDDTLLVELARADDSPAATGAQDSAKDLGSLLIEYSGVPRDGLIISNDRHGKRTFFGDNWPNRAHHWLPTVDRPGDKATVSFSVTAPAHYQVISVGSLRSEIDLGEDRRRTTWQTDRPIPTKVMVIGVGRFAVQNYESVRGVPIEGWLFSSDEVQIGNPFDETADVIEFFVDRIGEFPYEKLANVQSKTRYGGMENASAIFYSEQAVDAGANEGLVAHEIAHQWFGDAVSEADWHHVWLSEGFATYMTQLYLEWRYGSERLVEGMTSARHRVVTLSRGAPAPVIPTEIQDLNRLLSANSYQKGAWVLHMLRHKVGNDVFWDSIAEFYRRFQHGSATTKDFREVVEATWFMSGQTRSDLEGFFDQWLRRPGQPRVSVRFEQVEREFVDNSRNNVSEGETEASAAPQTSTGSRTMLRLIGEQEPFVEGASAFEFPLDVELISADGRRRVATLQFSTWGTTAIVDVDWVPVALVLDPEVRLLFEPGASGTVGNDQ